jgi:hypothetical protein
MACRVTNLAEKVKQGPIKYIPVIRNLFAVLLVGIFLLQIIGCASYMHGYTTGRYQGQWLKVAKERERPLPGNERLKLETDFDPSLEVFVAATGVPDYIHVIDRKSVELVYLKQNKIYRFKRPNFDVDSKLIKTYPAERAVNAGYISGPNYTGKVQQEKVPATSQSSLTTSEKKVAAGSQQVKTFQQSWAVVIGISKYHYTGPNGFKDLIFADDDAKAFAQALKKLGWVDSHIKLLVNETATRRNIMIALESWLSKAGPEDLIVLFWAGHGFPDPEDPEKVYLACHDTDISIPVTGYRMDRVRGALEERKVRNVILLADTCHAGKLITRGGRGVSIIPHIEKMNRQQTVPKGWIFMVGADSDRLAIENSTWSNGAFTHCLLKGLTSAADGYQSAGPKDTVVTMGELRTYLNTAMPAETQRVLGVAKRPVITTSSGDPGIWSLTLQTE